MQNLMGAAGATSRVRLMLEGSGSFALATGGVLRPTLEAGLRYDGGTPKPARDSKSAAAWGATQSGVQSLWTRQDASGLARGAAMDAAQRLQAELGYGLKSRKRDGLWYPYLAAEAADGGAQVLRMGLKLNSGPNVEMGLELGRRGNGREVPESALQLTGSIRW